MITDIRHNLGCRSLSHLILTDFFLTLLKLPRNPQDFWNLQSPFHSATGHDLLPLYPPTTQLIPPFLQVSDQKPPRSRKWPCTSYVINAISPLHHLHHLISFFSSILVNASWPLHLFYACVYFFLSPHSESCFSLSLFPPQVRSLSEIYYGYNK